MKTYSCLVKLVMPLVVIGLAACGGGGDGDGTAASPQAISSLPPAPPVVPPAPPSPFPAPTSASPYYLAAAAGGPVGGTVIGVHGGPPIRLGHLVVLDPASPTTPVALEASRTWQALAEVMEGAIDMGANSVSTPSTRLLVYL